MRWHFAMRPQYQSTHHRRRNVSRPRIAEFLTLYSTRHLSDSQQDNKLKTTTMITQKNTVRKSNWTAQPKLSNIKMLKQWSINKFPTLHTHFLGKDKFAQ